jgi:monoamine oxidase
LPQRPLHVCGEAWSEAQGWVEGALAMTEAMLQQEFKLSAPEWSGPKITTSD